LRNPERRNATISVGSGWKPAPIIALSSRRASAPVSPASAWARWAALREVIELRRHRHRVAILVGERDVDGGAAAVLAADLGIRDVARIGHTLPQLAAPPSAMTISGARGIPRA
jgi:hypothetical protein